MRWSGEGSSPREEDVTVGDLLDGLLLERFTMRDLCTHPAHVFEA